jgi:transposase
VVGRGELTDKAWAQLAPLLLRNRRRGGRWRDHRTVLNGSLWKLRTGAPWRDLPERYGPWQTCYDRLVRWRQDGTWDRLLAHAQTKSDAVGEVEWEVSVDSTVARAHQHAAGARKESSHVDAKKGVVHPPDEALGRGRGGFSSKVHLTCEGKGRPLSVIVTPGQRHESTQLEALLDGIGVKRVGGGRPRK